MLPSIALVLATVVSAETNSPPALSISDCDLGDAYAFATLDCEFAVSNKTALARKVLSASAVTSRDEIEPNSVEIPPFSTAYLHAKIRTGNSLAQTRHRFQISTDDIEHQSLTASARVFVLNALEQVKPEVNFGVVKNAMTTPSRSVTLTTHDAPSLRIEELLSKPEWCDVQIDKAGATVTVNVRQDAPWGIHQDTIKLKLNLPQQQEAWVDVHADIHGEVVPSINPIDLGLIRRGSFNSQLIKFTSSTGKNFTLGDAKLIGIRGTASYEKCSPPSSGCALLNLKISDDQPLGAIRGKIVISIPQFGESVTMEATGIILAADGVVDTLKPEAEAISQTSVSSRSNDVHNALKLATADARDATIAGAGPLLRWAISNGDLVHGFQIFRSNTENGNYLLLNKDVVPSKENGKETANYQYRDNSAESGKSYWYYVGIVYNDGHKQPLTQPQKAIAK